MALIPNLVIVGTPDNDELIAAPTRPWTRTEDDNTIRGLAGDDRIEGRGGDDLLDGGPGEDTIDGGSGVDTAVFSQTRQASEVFWYESAGGQRDAVVRGPDGTDALLAVEYLSFSTPSGVRDRAVPTDFPLFPVLDYAASYPDLASAFDANPDRAWLHYRDFGAKEDRTVSFSGLNYIASNPELSATLGTDARQGTLHYLQFGRLEGRSVSFDGLLYAASHDDLAAAFSSLGNARAVNDAGARHFLAYGRAEGRRADTFDPDQYLANYPDLGAAGLESPDQLALHYIAYGRAEGRTYEAPPNGLAYIASYPDLSAAFGTDARQGTLHFLQHGRLEGREATFDGLQYVAGYDDLAATFAPVGNAQGIADAGARHFITTGRAEGRQADNFDPDQYATNYPGLAAAGLDTPDELALHYISFGRVVGLTYEAPPNGLAYIASYQDLSAAFGTNASLGTQHFLQTGRREGREATFDGLVYVAGYDDLAVAFAPVGNAQGIADAGARHFITTGRAENRQPDNFNADQYSTSYPDLGAAGLDTPDELALHYILHGREEGRSYDVLIA